MWHAILENFRPGAVWIVDLAIFYVITAGEFGEAWTAWSWLELLGMGIMILGTAVYNGSVRVPGCEYDEDAGQRTKGEAGEENQFISKSSSSVTASPLIQRVGHRAFLSA